MKSYSYKNQPGLNRVYYLPTRLSRVRLWKMHLIANRFRILSTILLERKVTTVVSTIICLYTFLMTRSSRQIYAPPDVLDKDAEEGITNGSWRDKNLPGNLFFFLEKNFGHNYSTE